MEKYIIALKEMGVKDADILQIIQNCSREDLISAFDGEKESVLSNMALASCGDFFNNEVSLKATLKKATFILEKNRDNGIKTTIYGFETYPKQLINIPNPPVVLYYKGAELILNCKKAIACVGTRKPTKFSLNAINYLIPQWIQEGVSIISGLALGVDRLSHIACLANRGTTVAVLAHGLDSIYPKQNRQLAENILANGGTLVSEYPVEIEAANYRFINRNRIIVGLAQSTVVFECSENSGTMHSVDFAQKQHKPIFCPYPRKTEENNVKGIEYLLNREIAKVIPNGISYQIPLKSMGVVPQQESMSVSEILNCYLKSLICNIEMEMPGNTLSLLEKEFKIPHNISKRNKNVEEVINELILGKYITIGECISYLSSFVL